MDKDYLIKKWLTNTLTDDEWELFRKQDDYDLHLKLSEKAKNFKVSKGSLFDVITDAGKVSVLGTQFNVKNRQGYFEVVCYEGSVGVTYKDTVKILFPGNVFRVLHGEMSLDTIDNIQPHWLQNISNFIQVPFFEVVQELERQYNVKVDTKAVNTNRIFIGGFVHGDLEKALESITKPLGLTYIIQNQNSVVLKNSE